jgi:DNA mismatch repair protein MutL
VSVRVLPDQLVNKIAAGEVVERPASVVKELVENALDAGGRSVRVTLRGGGRSLVRVTDDGVGMDRDDAIMCLERHATSKIRDLDDLVAARTLGFRGEALPSIAAVSRFQLTTCPRDGEVGTRVRVDGGKVTGVVDTGCAPGTEIDVRTLFYNLPVRRKFLRTTATELGHCIEAVTRQALVRPEVDFRVVHDGREVLRAPATTDRAVRVRDLLGDQAAALVPVAFGDLGFEVSGLVSPVGIHRSSRTRSTYLFVNGRFIRDAILNRALNEAYRGIVPKGRYPMVVLEVRVDPTEVDVNVHPTKIEVRFRSPRDLVSVVSGGLREALRAHGIGAARRGGPVAFRRQDGANQPGLPLPAHPDADPKFVQRMPLFDAAEPPLAGEPGADWPTPAEVPTSAQEPTSAERTSAQGPTLAEALTSAEGPTSGGAVEPEALLAAEVGPQPGGRFRDLRLIGQFAKAWILCEAEGELVVVDQHAAHERVLLDQLLRDRKEQLGSAQRLLTPAVVDLPRGQAELLREHLVLLDELHLEVEPFGPASFAVKAVPSLLEHLDVPQLLLDVAGELADAAGSKAVEDLVERVLATMACHSAVRARDPLNDYEIESLLAALDEVDFAVCAHGRPVAVRISEAELAQRFHRT